MRKNRVYISTERKNYSNNAYAKDYKFDRVCFFRIATSHNTIIMREDKWFEEAVPKLKVTYFIIVYLIHDQCSLKLINNTNYKLEI